LRQVVYFMVGGTDDFYRWYCSSQRLTILARYWFLCVIFQLSYICLFCWLIRYYNCYV